MDISKLKQLTRNDLLGKIGLQTLSPGGQQWIPAITMLGVGILVGAGLGLMFARRPGRELRGKLRARIARKATHNGDPAVAAGPATHEPFADGV